MTIRHGWMAYAAVALVALWPARGFAGPGPGEVALGFGIGGLLDLPDAGQEHTRFGPGPMLMIPVRIGLTPAVNLRLTGRADMAIGNDRVTWAYQIGDDLVRFHDDDHFSMAILGGLTAGIEVVLPVQGSIQPYFGVAGGAGWFGTFHSFAGPTRHLLDPAQNDLDNPNNIDPYTSQFTWLTDVSLGMMTRGSTSFWFEAGYSGAWLSAQELKKSVPSLHARREAFGWNPVRLTLGVHFTL